METVLFLSRLKQRNPRGQYQVVRVGRDEGGPFLVDLRNRKVEAPQVLYPLRNGASRTQLLHCNFKQGTQVKMNKNADFKEKKKENGRRVSNDNCFTTLALGCRIKVSRQIATQERYLKIPSTLESPHFQSSDYPSNCRNHLLPCWEFCSLSVLLEVLGKLHWEGQRWGRSTFLLCGVALFDLLIVREKSPHQTHNQQALVNVKVTFKRWVVQGDLPSAPCPRLKHIIVKKVKLKSRVQKTKIT